MSTAFTRKLRVWRLLQNKTLRAVAAELRLPIPIVSAIERGEIEPSERWMLRFHEVYGDELAAELLAPADRVAGRRLGEPQR
jgi:transcriptional regulator with XRE-family HTH domain